MTDGFSDEEFERFRNAYLAGFRHRLGDLRARERHRQGRDVDGLVVEYHLRRLMRLIRRKRGSKHYGLASYLRRKFGHEGLIALYCLIDDFVEAVPWKLDWGKVMEATYALDLPSTKTTS